MLNYKLKKIYIDDIDIVDSRCKISNDIEYLNKLL